MIENLSGLPPYMAIVLFLAYLIWAKFLNKGKLRPEEGIYKKQPVDAIIVIFILFVFLLSIIWYGTVLYFSFLKRNEVLNWAEVINFAVKDQNFGWFMMIFAGISIFLLGTTIGKKEKSQTLANFLQKLLNYLLTFYFALLCIYLASYIVSPQYSDILYVLLIALLIPAIIFSMLIFVNLSANLFKFGGFNRKKYLILLFKQTITFSILIIFLLYILPPKFEIHDSTEHYLINDYKEFRYGLAKKEVKKVVNFKNGGYILKLGNINLNNFDYIEKIEFKYTDTNKYGIKENKNRYINLNSKKENLKFLGVIDYVYYNNTKNLVLHIDRKIFKQKNVSIIISGYKIENISDKFVINYTPLKRIRGNYYEQNVTFINYLNYSILGKDVSLTNYNRIFRRNCNLTDAKGFIEGKNNEISVDIRPDYSSLYIDFWDTRDFRLSIESPVYNLDDLKVSNFRISNNTIVHLTFIYECSS